MNQHQENPAEPQSRRLAYNPRAVQRLRMQIAHRKSQWENLIAPKTKPMLPCLHKAQLQRGWISKCVKCRRDEKHDISSTLLANDDLFCTQSLDTLQMKYEGSELMTLLKVEYRRYHLSKTMKSLAVHPVCLEMLRAFRDPLEVPVVFVVKESESDANRVVLEFILMLIGIRFEIVPISDEILSKNSINEKHTSILIVDNGPKHNLMEILNAPNNEIIFIPVTINFDKIDGRIYHDNLGLVKVNFIEPYAKSDMMKDMHNQSESERISAIIDHFEYDMLKRMPIMCTNVLAFLLLTRFREHGGSLESVCQAVEEIRHRHRVDIEFAIIGDTKQVLAYAMKMLEELIIVRDDNVKASDDDEKIQRLSKYSMPLARHFALQSILMISATYLDEKNGPAKDGSKYTIDQQHLVDMAELFAEKFNSDFQIMRPCADSSAEIENALNNLFINEILITLKTDENEEYDEDQQKAMRLADHLDTLYESDSDSEYDVFQKKSNFFNVRINREDDKMKDKIDAMLSVVPAMKVQLSNRSPIESILMISAEWNLRCSDENDNNDEKSMEESKDEPAEKIPTMKERIVTEAADLMEIMNGEFELQIEPREINNEAEKAFAKCLKLEYIVSVKNDDNSVHFKVNESKTAEIEDLKNQMLPTLDAYCTVAFLLEWMARHEVNEMNYNEFIVTAMQKLREDLEDGNAKFPQSLSKVLMKNAYKYFERQNLVLKSNDNVSLIYGLDKFEEEVYFMKKFLQ